MTEPNLTTDHQAAALEANRQKASDISQQWAARLDDFHLPCPLCHGTLVFHGVSPERLFEFAEGEPGVVEPLELFPIIFICDHCGYTAEFDSELFNPAYLARLSGAAPREAAALTVRDFRVLVALRGVEHNDTLLDLATALVGSRSGEVVTLNAAVNDVLAEQVEARLRRYHPAAGNPAPVRVLRRGNRRLQKALPEIVVQEQCDWVLLDAHGWPRGEEADAAAAINAVLERKDCDVALIYDRGLGKVSRILFATAGGPSAKAAAPFALQVARAFEAELHLLYVASPEDAEGEETGQLHITETLAGLEVVETDTIKRRVVFGADPVQIIINEAAGYDLLVNGGSPRGRRSGKRLESLSDKIARNTSNTAINVLAKDPRTRSWLGRLLGIGG
jgi:nucleotide-binding universal stress UspA family protein